MNPFDPLLRKYSLVPTSEVLRVLEQQRYWSRTNIPYADDDDVVVATIVPNGYGGVVTQKMTPNEARELLRLRGYPDTSSPWILVRRAA